MGPVHFVVNYFSKSRRLTGEITITTLVVYKTSLFYYDVTRYTSTYIFSTYMSIQILFYINI